MKKLLALILSLVMVASFAACGGNGGNEAGTADDFKMGVILLGDETESYTLAHIQGLKAAIENLGLKDEQVMWEYKIPEEGICYDKAKQLATKGCDLIISNSYGHQDYMAQAAEEYPDVTFISMTGDYAAISGLDNFKNAFNKVYESRYVSGVVAGLKIKELVDAGTISPEKTPENFKDGKVKVGYVGAFPFAEVKSGYTSFFLGIKSVYPDVTMDVTFTQSWFDVDKEGAAAEAFVADGCVIIGQHADSQGAPKAVQKALDSGKVCYSVGYNVSMLDVAPKAALTSATNCWDKYYTFAIESAMKGEDIPADWSAGYAEDAVKITDLGESCAEGTAEVVEETIASLKSGEIKVFDTATFTVEGKALTTDSKEGKIDLSYMDFSGDAPVVIHEGDTVDAIKTEDGVTYFDESTFRAAPYFAIDIDGINAIVE